MGSWATNLTKTPYLVLFVVLISVTVGTASALVTITLAGNVIITGDTELEGKLLDTNNDAGSSGQVLSSTEIGIDWVDAVAGSTEPLSDVKNVFMTTVVAAQTLATCDSDKDFLVTASLSTTGTGSVVYGIDGAPFQLVTTTLGTDTVVIGAAGGQTVVVRGQGAHANGIVTIQGQESASTVECVLSVFP